MKITHALLMGLVAVFAGLMIMVQTDSGAMNVSGDTRNLAELRQDLMEQKERRQELYDQIEESKAVLDQLVSEDDVEDLLFHVQESLREDAGFTEMTGEGVIIEIDLHFDETYVGGGVTHIPPYLLRLLINELNIQGARHIAIDRQRIVSSTAIREVEGRTLINGQWISYFPIQIQVLTDRPDDLRYAMLASNARDLFQYENMSFTAEVAEEITLPAYHQLPRIRYMEVVQEE
ncbi:DUF881 domain-containing protein [Salisediminibacterium selenitireducens]|uniref:DUF881 domain-containing protein n=1 Tax=Bacillus selenitireducens (strain ATCC 700615 / DSM 15326 / MLS10) TaxID=439292 RepID=D6XTN1_BACIE|nr:DUF881 domain-containing protein [Salisediminibacterium selenitireducens]ADH99167.1 protein of unknown function DUF881 [[Bacillus] selenitireducens MLS10]